MSVTFKAKLKLFSEKQGGRAFFQTTHRGMIGGIPFHLNSWEPKTCITCFILTPEPDYKFTTPQEVIVSMIADSTDEYLNDIQPGSSFVLWEGRVTAEGIILEREP